MPPRPARPVPAGLLALAPARPVADAALGSILLVLVAIVAITGFLSHAAYMPDLRPQRDRARRTATCRCTLRLADAPELALRAHPGPAHQRRAGRDPVPAGEAVVGHPAAVRVAAGRRARRRRSSGCRSRCWSSSAVFELATGVVNAQYWYPFKFNFVVAHYYGAIVFVASLALHVIVKLPVILRGLPRARRGSSRCATTSRTPSRSRPTRTALVTPNPAEPTISRRGLFAFAGAGALTAAGRPTSASRSAGRCASWRSSRRGASRGRLPGQQDRARRRASRRR